jgi:hypothetical protein
MQSLSLKADGFSDSQESSLQLVVFLNDSRQMPEKYSYSNLATTAFLQLTDQLNEAQSFF